MYIYIYVYIYIYTRKETKPRRPIFKNIRCPLPWLQGKVRTVCQNQKTIPSNASCPVPAWLIFVGTLIDNYIYTYTTIHYMR